MRCMAIDGKRFLNGERVDTTKVERVADCISSIRSNGEDPEVAKGHQLSKKRKCATVLIFLDNANDVLAKVLSTKLEQNSRKEGILYESTMFILMYTCSLVELQTFTPKESAVDLQTNDDCHIVQKMNLNEQRLFQSRLNILIEKCNCNVEDMLSFVIMAENFDENSPYVKKVVQDALMDVHLYSKQKDLLLYLAILKWYGNFGLPFKHCQVNIFLVH